MKNYKYIFETEPKPKKRPRVYRYATVNPSKEDEKKLVALYDGWTELEKPDEPLEGCLFVSMVFGILPSKSVSKKKRSSMLNGDILPNKSPDLDNYIKLVLDALNGKLWKDDRYIVGLNAMKHYSDYPYVGVEVEQL